jgi:hypothetical protein
MPLTAIQRGLLAAVLQTPTIRTSDDSSLLILEDPLTTVSSASPVFAGACQS